MGSGFDPCIRRDACRSFVNIDGVSRQGLGFGHGVAWIGEGLVRHGSLGHGFVFSSVPEWRAEVIAVAGWQKLVCGPGSVGC